MTIRETQTRQTSNPTSLPNLLTYGRILLVAVMVGAFFLEGDSARWTALIIFTLAGATDFFDGYLARAWAQQSRLGQMLDPIADKLLVSVALILLVAWKTISGVTLIPAIVILCREILVSGLREFLATAKVSVPVSVLAKWKTTLQMFALGFLLAGPAGDKVFALNTTVGIAGLWAAALLTLYTGYDYFRAGVRHAVDGTT